MKPNLSYSLMMALALFSGAASATDLRIYPSFSEVRETVKATGTTLGVNLPQETWNSVIPGSLDLDGVAFSSAVQKQEANWLTSLEGKPVFLRTGDKIETVTLIRARDLLIKDAQGRYRNVSYSDLSFSDLPPLNPQSPTQTLTYTVPSGATGTLSYLTRAVTWSPRFTLKASNAGAQLSALADIRNGTELPYNVQNTELYAGDVEVQEGQPVPAPAPMMRAEAAAADFAAPKINTVGEVRGLTRYDLSAPFTLPASSMVTLPFLTPKLTSFERYAGLNTYFNTETSKGTMNRFYRFKADQRLPSGSLTVREDGRIGKGADVEFSLGNDPDVRYTRSVETQNQQKDSKGNVTRTTYRVTYAFESSKDRAIRAEVTERAGGRRIIIDTAPAVQNQGVANLKVDVPANGKASKSFVLVIDNS
jgi:hypothetical protein